MNRGAISRLFNRKYIVEVVGLMHQLRVDRTDRLWHKCFSVVPKLLQDIFDCLATTEEIRVIELNKTLVKDQTDPQSKSDQSHFNVFLVPKCDNLIVVVNRHTVMIFKL